jgi:hypothetical protein
MSAAGNPHDHELQRLFESYRAGFAEVEPSRNFMPVLWQKIEARRESTVPFARRLAQGFAALAATASLGLVLLMVISPPETMGTTISYVEALADAHSSDSYVLQDIAYVESSHEDHLR